MSKPPIVAHIRWRHALVFDAVSGSASATLDGDSREGPSPLQTLAFSLVTCMAADVVYTLTKGRKPFRALSADLIAQRAPENPHRFLSVAARFIVEGDVPPAAVERAIALSHDKFCSVWHSMRQDIGFTTSFEVFP